MVFTVNLSLLYVVHVRFSPFSCEVLSAYLYVGPCLGALVKFALCAGLFSLRELCYLWSVHMECGSRDSGIITIIYMHYMTVQQGLVYPKVHSQPRLEIGICVIRDRNMGAVLRKHLRRSP